MTAGSDRIKHVFIWPAVLVILIVTLFPLAYSLTISFQQMRLVPPSPPRFVGLDNYATLLSQARFWQVLWNTSIIVLASVTLQYVLGFALALALHSKVPAERLFRVSFLFPMLMAPVAVALIWRMLFHSTLGPINQFFSAFGLVNLPFVTDPVLARMSLVLVEVWQWTPFVILLMLAGLQSLPRDIYEAAELEDASAWTQFRTITFPMLLPLSVAVVFIRIIEGFKIVDTVFVLTGGGPGDATTVLAWLTYVTTFNFTDFGKGNAYAYIIALITMGLSVFYIRMLWKRGEMAR